MVAWERSRSNDNGRIDLVRSPSPNGSLHGIPIKELRGKLFIAMRKGGTVVLQLPVIVQPKAVYPLAGTKTRFIHSGRIDPRSINDDTKRIGYVPEIYA